MYSNSIVICTHTYGSLQKFALDKAGTAGTTGTVRHKICLKLKSGDRNVDYEPCLGVTGTTGLLESEGNGVYTYDPASPGELMALF